MLILDAHEKCIMSTTKPRFGPASGSQLMNFWHFNKQSVFFSLKTTVKVETIAQIHKTLPSLVGNWESI